MSTIKRILKKAGVVILTVAMLSGQTDLTVIAEEITEIEEINSGSSETDIEKGVFPEDSVLSVKKANYIKEKQADKAVEPILTQESFPSLSRSTPRPRFSIISCS